MKTKFTSFFAKATLALLVVILAPPTEAWAQWSGSGDGTLADPYQISSYAHLKQFAAIVNAGNTSAYAKLVNDIVCKNSFDDQDYATDWTPIGCDPHGYGGTFDGQGHTITGLSTPADNSCDYVGLFGRVVGNSVVRNVILVDASLYGNNHVGSIAGSAYTGITIQNCALIGNSNISSSNYGAGGIAGENYGSIQNCYVAISGSGSISATTYHAGGIVGLNKGKVENCHYSGSGNISAYYNRGGIVGENSYSDAVVQYCYYAGTGDISSEHYVGAIIGNNDKATVQNSYFNKDNTTVTDAIGHSSNEGNVTNVTGLSKDQFKVEDFLTTYGFSSDYWIQGAVAPLLKAMPYTITFNANGGEGSMGDQTVTSEISDVLRTNNFTRSGYHFNGWNTKANGSGVAVATNTEARLVGPETLYAQWHTLIAHPAVAATCKETGNTAYWECETCHKYFSDAAGTTEISASDVVIPATGHSLIRHYAAAATCLSAGNSAFWECETCHKYFSDEGGTTGIAANSWVIPALGHNWNSSQMTAEPTCTENGARTLYCSRCPETQVEPVPATGHTLTEHPAVPATCTDEGNSAYWECETCHKYFSDAGGTTEIAANSWVIDALGHYWGDWVVGTPASCLTAGSQYRECTVCHAHGYDDIPALGHTLTEYVAVAATCTEAGNSAYWKCLQCGKYFSDAAGTTEIAENSWVIAATGHNFVNDECEYCNLVRIPYLDGGNTAYCTNFTVLDNTMNDLAAGWYVVNSDVTYSGNLTIDANGTVNIILCDGATLTANSIYPKSHSDRLNIYGQSQGTGTVNAGIVVTKDNFYSFFDENGILRDAVTFDELIFQGAFSNLAAGYVIITNPINITGDNAVLNNMGIVISSEDVTLDNVSLVANVSLGNLIQVDAPNVTLDNISVTYNAPADNEAKAIYAENADNFKLINSEITFTGADPGEKDYRGLEVINCDAAKIDKNTISAEFPAVPINWSGSGIDQGLVLAVGIQGGENVEFTNNIVNVNTNGSVDSYPTIDAVMVHSTEDILIKGNKITHLDTTPEDGPRYYYSLDIYSTTGTVEANDITVNTTTANNDVRAGTAYAIQVTGPSIVTIIDNNLTAISKGPVTGIYATNWMGETTLTVENNNIDVTGYATTGNYALVAGVEAEIDVLEAYNNTITVANGADYDDANHVIGVGVGSTYFYSEPIADIQVNNMTVDGKYAVYYAKAKIINVTDNILCAHLFGDDAVYIAEGDGNTVKDNRGGTCGDTSIHGGADVAWLYDNDTHTLTISGTGPMMYYGSTLGSDNNYHSTAPWSYLDSEIQKVIVENGVTYIGSYAFAYCSALTSVSLPASVVALGDYVCYTSGVTRIDIPNTTAAATLGTGGFGYCPTSLQIAVPSTLLGTYQTADNWSAYEDNLVGVLSEATGFDDGFAAGNYEYSRTFKCGTAATLCLPFSITAAQAAAVGQFYSFAGIDKTATPWEVIMEAANTVSTDLTANTPYLFVPFIFDGKSKGEAVGFTFSGTVDNASNASYNSWTETSSSYWTFQGVYYNLAWNDGNENLGKIYGFAAQSYEAPDNDNDGNPDYAVSPGDFVKAMAGASIAPFRAFLQYNPATNAPRFRGAAENSELPASMTVRLVDAGGIVTAVGTLNTKTGVVSFDDSWYDMNGRKLNSAPNARGIYINNGKKVIVK